MGIDAGFDMVPPLSRSDVDKTKWAQFIEVIKDRYENDKQIDFRPNYILFKVGEHPTLPFEGHKFLRFSSKVSGSNAMSTRADDYIRTVTRLARAHFGSRVQHWHEASDSYGTYGWKEVQESIGSYEKPDEPEARDMTATLSNGDDSGIPIFEVKEIPGKGRGLVARLDIAMGTRILCEKPLLTAPSMPPNQVETYLAAKLKALPKASQRQILSLHNKSPGKFPFTNTFKTNALPCGLDSLTGALYPTICLINHSCIPNVQHTWNSEAEHETIHAIRPIKLQEEITISYDRGGTSNVRRAFLKESFGLIAIAANALAHCS